MNRHIFMKCAALFTLGGAFFGLFTPKGTPGKAATSSRVREVLEGLGEENPQRPTGSSFTLIPNVGQWKHKALFAGRMGAMTFFAEERGWVLTLEGEPNDSFRDIPLLPWSLERKGDEPQVVPCVAIRMRFQGGVGNPEVQGRSPRPGYYNFFLGKDPGRWRRKIKGYGAIRYKGLYPGIDLLVGESKGRLEYDLYLSPGADLGSVQVQVEGIEGLEISPEGALVMKTNVGDVVQPRPRTWEVGARGEKRPVFCRYRLLGERTFGFVAEGWEGTNPLVLDPGIVWSTFLGGSIGESAWDMVRDSQGNLILTGTTNSKDYPTTVGAYSRTYKGGIKNFGDAVVTKMAADGKRLIWSTFLGGKESDVGYCVALDGKGRVIVTGPTPSPDFPTTQGVYDRTYNGPSPSNYRIGYGGDAFVSCLSGDGSKLIWSTYVGGKDMDYPMALAIASNGDILIGGGTESFDFPTTTGSFMPKHKPISGIGNNDGFLSRLSMDGKKLVASTFLGGDGDDWIHGIAIGKSGVVAVAGMTVCPKFPITAGAYDTSFNDKYSGFDCFVSQFNPGLAGLMWSTFLGGRTTDSLSGIKRFKNGDLIVFGNTISVDFPTTPGVFQQKFKGDWSAPGHQPDDCFVSRLDSSGSRLVWSTFLGGKGFETIKDLELDGNQVAWFVGVSTSRGFPVTPGARNEKIKNYITPPADIVYGGISPDGRRLLWGSFIGGFSYDNGISLAIGPGAVISLTGATNSQDYPVTAGAFDTKYNYPSNMWDVSGEMVVSRLVVGQSGIKRFGAETPSCQGAVTIYAGGSPKSGNSKFSLVCWKAPFNTVGLLMLGVHRLSRSLHFMGADFWVDPSHGPFVTLAATSDKEGKAAVKLPLPYGARGLKAYAQFLWANTKNCPGRGPLSASDALEITIQ